MIARTTRLAWGACSLTVLFATLAVVLTILRGSHPVPDYADAGPQEMVVGVVLALGFGVLGALIAGRHASNPIGWLFCVAGLMAALTGFSQEYAARALLIDPGSLPAGEALAWVSSWAWIWAIPLAGTVLLLLFPNGRLPSPRWRPVLWFSVAVLAGLFADFALTNGELEEFPAIDNPVGFLPQAFEWAGALMVPAVALAFSSVVVRYRAALGEERQQLKWMAAAAVLFLCAMAVEFVVSLFTEAWFGLPTLVATAAVVGAAGVAVLKYRLYDLDLVVNRTLVYGFLTALVVAGYVGLVAGLGELVDSTGIGVSLAATAVVAVAIQPLRAVVQRRVDRLMYGDRDDPYRALARLGERLERAVDPDSVLPAIVEAVAEGLRLPYAAIELSESGERRIVARHGEARGGELTRLPLEYRGETVGRLIVAPRAAGEPLADADLRLLGDLARQAGVAAHAVRLTQDLRRSRERLVTAREEERRRLRRDLHDGLGPSLAAIALEIASARVLVGSDPDGARRLLEKLRVEVQESIADIRRIAYDLRPPTLDELGLLAALREQAARLGSGANDLGTGRRANSFQVTVEAPDELPALPAAVEVAAYRIALEALTNVSRHAGAARCVVRIAVNGQLEVEVTDDGAGLARDPREGLGLVSMRERAEELGGRLSVGAGVGGRGTIVRASLPVVAR